MNQDPGTDEAPFEPRSDQSGASGDDPAHAVGADAGGEVPVKRHLLALALGVLALIVGIVLVVTGRESSTPTRSPSISATPTVVRTGPLLRSLGSVADRKAALVLLRTLDPDTLDPPGGGSTPASSTSVPADSSAVNATAAGVQRCTQAIDQQTRDRALGRRTAEARLQVGESTAFVLSYQLPASGSSPAGTRLVLVDARTCRILGAVDH